MRCIALFLLISLVACSVSPTTAITPDAVLAAFQEANLEAADARPMTVNDYGLAPMGEEGLRFMLPSVCTDCGGRIIRYESSDAAAKGKAFYDELGKSSAAFFSWAFQNGPIVVQINGDLPEEQARQYEAVLADLP